MSKTFERVLVALHELGDEKINELDRISEGYRGWLVDVVEDAKRHVESAMGPASKRQKVQGKTNVAVVVKDESELVRGCCFCD